MTYQGHGQRCPLGPTGAGFSLQTTQGAPEGSSRWSYPRTHSHPRQEDSWIDLAANKSTTVSPLLVYPNCRQNIQEDICSLLILCFRKFKHTHGQQLHHQWAFKVEQQNTVRAPSAFQKGRSQVMLGIFQRHFPGAIPPHTCLAFQIGCIRFFQMTFFLLEGNCFLLFKDHIHHERDSNQQFLSQLHNPADL